MIVYQCIYKLNWISRTRHKKNFVKKCEIKCSYIDSIQFIECNLFLITPNSISGNNNNCQRFLRISSSIQHQDKSNYGSSKQTNETFLVFFLWRKMQQMFKTFHLFSFSCIFIIIIFLRQQLLHIIEYIVIASEVSSCERAWNNFQTNHAFILFRRKQPKKAQKTDFLSV